MQHHAVITILVQPARPLFRLKQRGEKSGKLTQHINARRHHLQNRLIRTVLKVGKMVEKTTKLTCKQVKAKIMKQLRK